jgi:hypothetical protein
MSETFEYKTVEKWENEFAISTEKETEYLNKEGILGWELVGIVNTSFGRITIYYWKRRHEIIMDKW